ncbi:DUF6232 family protein [Photobacterium nomapromontoriensis]|uniref:DUF6232 family protein n=1 Tax=Photobacterium nomapromontoriensis TaxID=2910237 RepID=UPI003D096445
MYQESDFRIQDNAFSYKRDTYPLSKINDVRVKELSLLDNIGQLVFWLVVFTAGLWFGIAAVDSVPQWLVILVASLTLVAVIFALFRCSRYALQVEFKHIDETGLQWVNVAKSYSKADSKLFKKLVIELKQKII